MANTTKHKPGSNCDKTGKYAEYDEAGTLVNDNIDVEAGRKFPPAQSKGSYFKLDK